MSRREYLREVVRLYLAEPDTPVTARPSDWAIAAALYERGVPIVTLAHAFRLATLRRHQKDRQPQPIHSLAYFREVVTRLTPDDHEPSYVDYITRCHRELLHRLGEPHRHAK